MARCGDCRSDALDDVAWLLDNGLPVKVVQIPAGRSGCIGKGIRLDIERRQPIAEEDPSRALRGPEPPAEYCPRESVQVLGETGMLQKQSLILQVQVFSCSSRALVLVVELAQCFEVVLRSKKLPAL